MQNKTMNLRNMVLIAMLGAIAFILMYLEIPLPFIAPAFYEMDFSEVPVLIGAFAMGPGAGVAIEFLKILLHTLLRGTSTAYVGEIANFVVGCALVVPAGLLYRRKKTRGHALAGMALGTLLMVTAGSLINAYVLLPWYANHFFAGAGGMEGILAVGAQVHAGAGTLLGFVLLCVAPFNLIKGVVVSGVTMLLYKRVSVVIKGHGAEGAVDRRKEKTA